MPFRFISFKFKILSVPQVFEHNVCSCFWLLELTLKCGRMFFPKLPLTSAAVAEAVFFFCSVFFFLPQFRRRRRRNRRRRGRALSLIRKLGDLFVVQLDRERNSLHCRSSKLRGIRNEMEHFYSIDPSYPAGKKNYLCKYYRFGRWNLISFTQTSKWYPMMPSIIILGSQFTCCCFAGRSVVGVFFALRVQKSV